MNGRAFSRYWLCWKTSSQQNMNFCMKQLNFWRLHNLNSICGPDVQSLQASVYYTYLTAWSYKVLHVLWNRSRSIYFDNNIDDKKNEGGQNYEQKHAKLHLPIPLITAHHQLEQITIWIQNHLIVSAQKITIYHKWKLWEICFCQSWEWKVTSTRMAA